MTVDVSSGTEDLFLPVEFSVTYLGRSLTGIQHVCCILTDIVKCPCNVSVSCQRDIIIVVVVVVVGVGVIVTIIRSLGHNTTS